MPPRMQQLKDLTVLLQGIALSSDPNYKVGPCSTTALSCYCCPMLQAGTTLRLQALEMDEVWLDLLCSNANILKHRLAIIKYD